MNALKRYIRWLRQARCRFLGDDVRVARAFDAGYVLLLDAAPVQVREELTEHPTGSVIRTGSRALGLGALDATAGLRLLRWVDWDWPLGRKAPPCDPSDAISWAQRIRALYTFRCATRQRPGQ